MLCCIKPEVQAIYGLLHPERIRNCNEPDNTDKLTKDQRELLAKIMKVEKGKGCEIDAADALKILSFLSDLAKICIAVEMLQEEK